MEHTKKQERPCGSAGKDLLSRLITWLAPQKPFGVDIKPCCENHDIGWKERANKTADKEFRNDIKKAFEQKRQDELENLFTDLYQKDEKTEAQILLLLIYIMLLPVFRFFTSWVYYFLVGIGRGGYKLVALTKRLIKG